MLGKGRKFGTDEKNVSSERHMVGGNAEARMSSVCS